MFFLPRLGCLFILSTLFNIAVKLSNLLHQQREGTKTVKCPTISYSLFCIRLQIKTTNNKKLLNFFNICDCDKKGQWGGGGGGGGEKGLIQFPRVRNHY